MTQVVYIDAATGAAKNVQTDQPLPVQIVAGGGTASPNKTEDTAAVTGDTGAAVMAIQTAAPADKASEADYAFLQMAEGGLWVAKKPFAGAGGALAPVVAAALATSKVIKASAGNLYGFNGMATTVAGIFLIHNSATAPAAGAVTPIKAYPVAAGQAVADKFDPPIRFSTGISITFTSAATPFTQTDSATAFIEGDAV